MRNQSILICTSEMMIAVEPWITQITAGMRAIAAMDGRGLTLRRLPDAAAARAVFLLPMVTAASVADGRRRIPRCRLNGR